MGVDVTPTVNAITMRRLLFGTWAWVIHAPCNYEIAVRFSSRVSADMVRISSGVRGAQWFYLDQDGLLLVSSPTVREFLTLEEAPQINTALRMFWSMM